MLALLQESALQRQVDLSTPFRTFIYRTIYFEYLFHQLPNLDSKLEGQVLDEYLPWSDKIQYTEDNKEGKLQSETA
jgi:hypothetical protein